MSKTRNYFKDFIKNITIKGTVMDGTFTSTFNSHGMINTGTWKENKNKWTHNFHSYLKHSNVCSMHTLLWSYVQNILT